MFEAIVKNRAFFQDATEWLASLIFLFDVTRVDYMDDSVDSNRGLGNICGHNNFPKCRGVSQLTTVILATDVLTKVFFNQGMKCVAVCSFGDQDKTKINFGILSEREGINPPECNTLFRPPKRFQKRITILQLPTIETIYPNGLPTTTFNLTRYLKPRCAGLKTLS